jgi:hypothetical protein
MWFEAVANHLATTLATIWQPPFTQQTQAGELLVIVRQRTLDA